MAADLTRYGEPRLPLIRAAAPLRARAAAAGLTLVAVDEVTLTAAVLGAELWCVALGTTDLARPARHGPGALAALAAVVRRAAGSGSPPAPLPEAGAGVRPLDQARAAAVEACVAAARGTAPEAIPVAVGDLWVPDRRLQAVAAAVAIGL